ncbi:hypothetical protein Pst134EA_033106 [Puccinia striiformis f. sp. tritici]|uniref:hypothetical protein n=1 Tax=Puccinia striiformis f. sp. tritici TaxID=168172 RepID=UPI002008E05F|nr:hypothetical protein Pst134EA_033106 [Puccinia striiformis f. sp. tritici]KAH9453466.1 hypothetical protein Pst134EA_033106 [Puccinia striiformis f. sp. tritici]
MILDGLKMATNPWTRMADDHSDDDTRNGNGGSGSELPPNVLWSASLSAGLATLLSFWCIVQQLRNYRKPILQRFVVRILFMVPIYSISTLISLYSLDAAFFIDLIRDIYEAFVIYCFFGLLVEYLGGERSLLILIHGREPTPHPWPFSQLFSPIDISDPYTFLNIKRGIFQYVQVKPILVIVTVIFKATKTYNDGDLKFSNGYTYVSLGYNFSVSLCLYCLGVFWMCTGADLKPFRPMPKFLCIKGVIFFSFWQGFGISILVALGLLKSTRYPTETLSLAIQDTLICFEMPLFSILHLYAFSHRDFIEPNVAYCGRLPFVHAFRDSILGFKDVLEDTVMTLRGTGFSYKTFEPAEGALHHHGIVRERRVRAGLRYSAGGKQKYWLPMAGENEGLAYGRKPTNEQVPGAEKTRWTKFMRKITPGKDLLDSESGYAPLLPEQAAEVIHREGEVSTGDSERRPLNDHLMGNVGRWDLAGLVYGTNENGSDDGSDLDEVAFGEPREEEESLYRDARRLAYGDYNSPVVDASAEEASRLMRAREDGMLANHPAAPSSWKGKARHKGTSLPGSGTGRRTSLLHNDEVEEGHHSPSRDRDRRLSDLIGSPPSKMKSSKSKAKNPQSASLPEGCVDLFIEDRGAMEERTRRNRLKGEANRFTGVSPEKVFKVLHPDLTTIDGPVSSTDPSDDNKKILDPQQNPKVDFSIDLDPQNPPSVHDSTTPEVQMIVNLEDNLQAVQVEQENPALMSSHNANSDLNNHHHSHHPDGDQDSTTSQENHFKPGKRASLSSNSINQNPWEHY